jgi:sugar phosphate isomerase/epimerase
MTTSKPFSRRSFLAAAAAAAPVLASAKPKHIPVGIELYSVRDELSKDLMGTVKAVAKMGYEGVEFYSPYLQWTSAQATDVRKLLDDLNIKCFSTHNGPEAFGDKMGKAIELNQIIGSQYIVMASAGRVQGLDGWKAVADKLNAGAEKFKSSGMSGAGYHNHQAEFKELEGKRPIEVIAANTSKDVMLQFDIGTAVEVGYDPVTWINKNPGRIRSMHCKEWSAEPGVGYKALFGEGKAPWKQIFQAAEKTGGIEYYLIEQEGSRFTPFETAEKCLEAYKKLRA